MKPKLLVVVSPVREALARDAFDTAVAMADRFDLAFIAPKENLKVFGALGPVSRWRPNQIVGMTLAIRTLRLVAKRFAPDLVHAHGFGAAAVTTGTFPVTFARRTIVSLHDQLLERELSVRYVDRALAKNIVRAAQVTAAYPTLARAFEKRFSLTSGAIAVIPHASTLEVPDVELARPAARPGPVLGWYGRLRADRAWELAIDALAAIRTDLPQARLRIGGTGGALQLVAAYARQQGVGDIVELVGEMPMQAFFATLDAYVAPLSIDAQQHAVLDALVYGVPIVAANEGALADAIGPLPTGWLVPNDRDGFASGIRTVWSSIDDAWAGANAQRPLVRATYGQAAVLERWSALYDRVLASAGDAAPSTVTASGSTA